MQLIDQTQFVLDNSETIARLSDNHGPRLRIGDNRQESREFFLLWLAKVALLAAGQEEGCGDGGTFANRKEAAESIAKAWRDANCLILDDDESLALGGDL